MHRTVCSAARRILALSLFALFAVAPHAAAQFITQSPSPTGRNLGGVAFTSPTHGFIVGDNHHLLETFDAGTTWTARMATGYSTDPFYTIHFFDAQHGYIAGNNTDAYRTTDGGTTWSPMPGMLAGSVRALDFITPTSGYAGYNGAFTHTSNGGLSWQLRCGYPDAPIVFGMDFRDENVGLACGIRVTPYNDGGIYRTEDGGATWTVVLDQGANDVLWIDDATALALVGFDVYRSDDAGLTWYAAALGSISSGASEIARAGQTQTLGAVSGVGDIWMSYDLGYSWQQVIVGIGVLPANWAISFYDDQNGWVVGANGLAYRTTNGGLTWDLLNNGCGDEVMDIAFTDEDYGAAVTHRGFVFLTRDRGAHWEVQRLRETGIVFGREEGLRAVAMVDRDFIVTGGSGGILFRTEDNGETWFNYGYPYADFAPNYEIRTVRFTDRYNGWIGGFYGNSSVYRTYDGGVLWYPVEGPIGSIVAIDTEGGRVWAATGGSVVHRSFDDGQTWTAVGLPGDVYYLSDIEFKDANNGWAVGWWGYMAKTTNGGVTWTAQTHPQNETYFDIEMNTTADLMVVGYDNSTYRYFIKRSTNGGATWTRTTLNQYEEAFSTVHLRPAGRYWLGGATGKVLYSPAAPLQITLPTALPQQVPPGEAFPLGVRIVGGEEQIAAGSETLWLRRSAGGNFEPIPLIHAGGDDYTGTLPPLQCTDTPQFYFSVQGDAGTTVTLPPNAPTGYYTMRVGTFETVDLLAADFESGLPAGWSATGLWHVTSSCAPLGSCGGGGRAYFGQDGLCSFNIGSRVSGVLRSPQIALPALQAGQSLTLTFCSALDTEYGDGEYGDDDQAQLWWVSGTQAPLEWFTDHSTSRTQTFTLNLRAGQTGRLEWRFDTMNDYMNNFRGWHVDNVRLTGPALVCEAGLPADANCDGLVDNGDIDAFVLALIDPAAYATTYPGCPISNADVNGDGTTDNGDIDAFVQCLLNGGC